MRQLGCSVCGEKQRVSPGVNKVTCAECYITGETPRVEGRAHYRSPDSFKKIVSAGIDDWEIIKDKKAEERELIKKFNRMKKRKNSLIEISRKLGISWRKVNRLEAYRLLNLGWKRKDIANELGVNLSTISKWKVLQKELSNDQTPYDKKKKQHSHFESSSSSSSSESKNQENQGLRASKIDYHFSKKTLDFVRRENEQTHD